MVSGEGSRFLLVRSCSGLSFMPCPGGRKVSNPSRRYG